MQVGVMGGGVGGGPVGVMGGGFGGGPVGSFGGFIGGRRSLLPYKFMHFSNPIMQLGVMRETCFGVNPTMPRIFTASAKSPPLTTFTRSAWICLATSKLLVFTNKEIKRSGVARELFFLYNWQTDQTFFSLVEAC